MAETPLRYLGATIAFTLAAHCGARTGLRVEAQDGAVDVGEAVDAVRPVVCRPLRVRTRMGDSAALQLRVDGATETLRDGYVWSLRTAPRRARADVVSNGSADATLTPDVEGTWDLSVRTPYTNNGTSLVCPVTVTADPADPLCPSYSLVEPQVVALPSGDGQFAFEGSWSTPRVNRPVNGETAIVATDAAEDDVAALLIDQPARMVTDLAMFAGEIEGRVASSVGAIPVLVGREGTTTSGLRYRRSSFRVSALTTTANVVRDRVARDVGGLNPGVSPGGFHTAQSFVIEVTTVLRPTTQRALVILATAPEGLYDDPRTNTATRLTDVTNTTGLGARGATLDVLCQRSTATRNVTADFLWLVDTSRSMEDDQERLGNTAERFFREFNTAGVDFRVGVIQAGSIASSLNLDAPGFDWISGSSPNGPQQLAWQVTFQRYHEDPQDNLAPYNLDGQKEEPLAAAVITTEEMERRTTTDRDDRRRFRNGATRVAFFVTDEAGTNDDARFFVRDRVRWGALDTERVRNVTRWFHDRDFLTFGLVNLFERQPCPRVENFVACVVTGNNGAFIPISTANDAEVSAALSRIVDAVAGAASEFSITRPPISSTLRVRVDETLAPRSRADGFDYDANANTIVFRGGTYRPRRGQTVRSAYFFWR